MRSALLQESPSSLPFLVDEVLILSMSGRRIECKFGLIVQVLLELFILDGQFYINMNWLEGLKVRKRHFYVGYLLLGSIVVLTTIVEIKLQERFKSTLTKQTPESRPIRSELLQAIRPFNSFSHTFQTSSDVHIFIISFTIIIWWFLRGIRASRIVVWVLASSFKSISFTESVILKILFIYGMKLRLINLLSFGVGILWIGIKSLFITTIIAHLSIGTQS